MEMISIDFDDYIDDEEELIQLGDFVSAVEDKQETKRFEVVSLAEKHAVSPLYVADAERQLVGACLLDPQETMNHVEEVGLKASDFYVESLRHIFTAIESLHATKKQISVLSVVDHLHKRKTIDFTGGQKTIANLESSASFGAVSLAKTNCQMILEKSKLRSIMREAGKALERSRIGEQPADIIEDLFKSLATISIGRSSSNIANLQKSVKGYLDTLPAFGGKTKGMSMGFADLDYYFKPGPGDLIIIAARPSMGKTAFVLDVARHFAVQNDLPVMFFSLEMTAEQLVGRMISAQSGVPSRKPKITSSETIAVTKASGDISACPLFIDETPSISIGEIKARARSLARSTQISMIVVDYIQLVTPTRQTDNRATEVGEISAGLKAIAREIGCPVIALSQLNRAVETRNDRRPLMSDLRESGSIEQDADVVSFLYREEYYAKDKTPPDKVGVAELIVGKNRNGPTGSVNLSFNSQLPRFGNLQVY